VAFAIGGGIAGALAARERTVDRTVVVAAGMTVAGVGALLVGYGGAPALTIAGALVISLMGTSALIRVWAALADVHGERRAVAMTEGEVSVSLAGILTPLLIGGLAATALTWRFALVLGAGVAVLSAVWVWRTPMPAPAASAVGDDAPADRGQDGARRRLHPMLVVVFGIVALEFSLSFWLASYLVDDVGLSRGGAAAAVSGLYAANLAGRLLASRLARRVGEEVLLGAALATALAGLPVLLAAHAAVPAVAGIAVVGMGIGALFPLTSAIYIKSTAHSADNALGHVLTVAAFGQLAGPLTAGAIAQAAGLRAGLLILPGLVVVAAAALGRHVR
jgi:MFS family permease